MDLTRAYVYVELDELRVLARMAGRPWCTLEEYARVTHPGFQAAGGAVRRSRFRLARLLAAEHALTLRMETHDGELQIHVCDPAIERVIEPALRTARAIVEAREAKRQGAEPAEDDDDPIDASQVVVDYRDKMRSFAWIVAKWRLGRHRLRRVLVAACGVRPARGLGSRIEHRRPRAAVALALREADAGASCARVAQILDCSHDAAARFLRRHGRKPERMGRGARWRKA